MTEALGDGNDFCCSLSATLIARVVRVSGREAVGRLLREARSPRTVEYLTDIANWLTYDEAIALFEAGQAITGEEDFARNVGADAVKALGSSMTAATLRALGSPEALLGQMAVAAHRFSTVATLEAVEVRPGHADIRALANPGFSRHPLHCAWTAGLLSTTSELFGYEPSAIEHDVCQARGDAECRYRVTWAAGVPAEDPEALRRQLDAMTERLENVFATASDLLASGDIDQTLARITDRAALQVRAPRYLLAVRATPEAELHWHQKGFGDDEARTVAERVLADEVESLPEHWLVADVASARHHYGSLVAAYQPGAKFFPQERQLLEVYARYAASALDTATALREATERQREAQRRYEESRALLELARQLATADSSEKIAQRLADAVPAVVDCDRVSVYLWDDEIQALVRRVVTGARPGDANAGWAQVTAERAPFLNEWRERPDPEPHFIDFDTSAVAPSLRAVGAVAAVAVPIATDRTFLGCVVVSVLEGPERLAPGPELRDRLSGVAAHAVGALENGRLVDAITFQANHDQLTGLANRAGFAGRLARTEGDAGPLAMFYVDLDGFKPVNDRFGHEVGDGVLRIVGARLLERVRPSDTVARLGGDEFAVLVTDIESPGQVEHITRRLQETFDEPVVVDGHTFAVSASIGRAIWPVDVDERQALLRHADAEMYAVKRSKLAA